MVLNPSAHKNILLKILLDMYSDNTVGPFLGFKGGTAAYLFYGLDRFSVDIDFDLLNLEKEDYVFERVKKIMKKYGELKDAKKKRFNLFYVLSYSEKEKKAKNIRVEINRRNFGSKYELKSFMGISMLVMVKEDMFANKLLAMYERLGKTNRDVFDVWFFSKNNWPINKEIVEKRAQMPFNEFLQKAIVNLENFNDHNILDGMGELLTEKQKVWAKAKLKSETIFLLKLALEAEK